MDEIFAGYGGVYGDRLFAFASSASPKGFPFFTAREQRQMLRYRPHFRDASKAAHPINLEEATKLSPNINPISARAGELMIDVETPDGKTFPIDHPQLIDHLCAGLKQRHDLRLLRSDKAMTDCRPVSIFAVQTAQRLAEEIGMPIDKRRFRSNIYLDLAGGEGFAEDKFVGKSLRLGPKAVISILQRDGRCLMVTLDPETAEKSPAVLKQLAQVHEGMAGVYGAVLAEGLVRRGDSVELLD